MSPAAAGELSALETKIPPDEEVIASQGVIGRFGAGHVAFSYWARQDAGRTRSREEPVVFILAPVQGTAEGIPEETRRAIQYVGTGALTRRCSFAATGSGSISWTPEPGTTSVALP